MSNKIVSQTYFDACERIHKATDVLYESLHNEEGTEAIIEYQEVLSTIKSSQGTSAPSLSSSVISSSFAI